MKQYINEYDEALNALTSDMLDTSDIKQYMDTIISSLKKQILMKPEPTLISNKMLYWYRCPICHSGITKYYPYCGSCGQMLDWEDV